MFYVGHVIRSFWICIFNRGVTFVCAALPLFLCLPIGRFFWNDSDVTWVLRRLKSSTTQPFAQHLVKTNTNNKNKKYTSHLWPFLGKPTKMLHINDAVSSVISKSNQRCTHCVFDIFCEISCNIYIIYIIICLLSVKWMSSSKLEVLCKIQSISFGKMPLKMISAILLAGAHRWTCVHTIE